MSLLSSGRFESEICGCTDLGTLFKSREMLNFYQFISMHLVLVRSVNMVDLLLYKDPTSSLTVIVSPTSALRKEAIRPK